MQVPDINHENSLVGPAAAWEWQLGQLPFPENVDKSVLHGSAGHPQVLKQRTALPAPGTAVFLGDILKGVLRGHSR